MRVLLRILSVLSFSMAGQMTLAQDLPLQNLTESDFKSVIGDFSANFMHTSVSGAGTLGRIFGFEVGLVGGVTKTPEIERVAHQTDPTAKADQFPHGELLGVLTVPFGITAEIGLIPTVGGDEFKFRSFSLAAKWTPTEIFWDWPVDFAVKALMTKSHAEFTQTISSTPVNFDYDNSIYGLTAIVSKSFVIVEPYFGIGVAKASGELSASGSATVFDASYTASSSAKSNETTTYWMAGAELKLLAVKLGLEYTNLFDTHRFSGKLSVYF